MDYIEKIKQLLKKERYSQTELSQKLGLSRSTYGLYETHKRNMDIETFRKICIFFNVSADELLGLPAKK